jgi:hypothetical protein
VEGMPVCPSSDTPSITLKFCNMKGNNYHEFSASVPIFFFALVATLILGWNIGRYYQVRFHSGWYSIPVVVLDLCSNPEIDRKVHSSQNWGNSQLHKSEIGSSWINHPFIYQFAMENCLFIIYWSNMISWIYLNGSWMIYLLSTGDFPFNFSWRKLRNPWGSPVVNGDCRTPVFSFSVKGEPT